MQFVLHIIPNAFFGAFAEGEVLPVLLIAIICGFGLTRIGVAGKPVLEGINSFAHMLFAAFGLIMKLAPLGAFGAMAFTVGKYGIKSIGSLGMLIVTFYVACGFFRRRRAGCCLRGSTGSACGSCFAISARSC